MDFKISDAWKYSSEQSLATEAGAYSPPHFRIVQEVQGEGDHSPHG